jgi:hypothetical protein
MTPGDDGPFEREEQGWHVRRGYTKAMLEELCDEAGLLVEGISYCSGLSSQKVTTLMRIVGRIHPALGWASVLGLRPLPPLVDGALRSLTEWPDYSIGLEAYKPRYGERTPRASEASRNGHARASAR